MGTELALCWSLPSVYTSSVIRAYFLPPRGVLGAGEGGKSWPSMSCEVKAFPVPLSFALEPPGAGASDMIARVLRRTFGFPGLTNLRVEANSIVAVEGK